MVLFFLGVLPSNAGQILKNFFLTLVATYQNLKINTQKREQLKLFWKTLMKQHLQEFAGEKESNKVYLKIFKKQSPPSPQLPGSPLSGTGGCPSIHNFLTNPP